MPKKRPAPKQRNGRRGQQPVYTRALAKRICERIAQGESLAAICRGDAMPAAPTVRGWILDDRDGFAAFSARAYEIGHEALAEQCLEIADAENEDPRSRRIKIDTRLRLLGKWAPKRYGDRTTIAGDPDNPLRVDYAPVPRAEDPETWARMVAEQQGGKGG